VVFEGSKCGMNVTPTACRPFVSGRQAVGVTFMPHLRDCSPPQFMDERGFLGLGRSVFVCLFNYAPGSTQARCFFERYREVSVSVSKGRTTQMWRQGFLFFKGFRHPASGCHSRRSSGFRWGSVVFSEGFRAVPATCPRLTRSVCTGKGEPVSRAPRAHARVRRGAGRNLD
jgi:hypothetical protein